MSWDDQQKFFDNFNEAAETEIGRAGVFFTSTDLALDLALEAGTTDRPIRVLDLCAGIGVLSWAFLTRCPNAKITAIECNSKFVDIGEKLLPEVDWICGSLADLDLRSLGQFDIVVSNPPFGVVPSMDDVIAPRYTGSLAHYKVMDIAANMAATGVFLIPQQAAPFKYSGVRSYSDYTSKDLEKFVSETNIEMGMNMGIDTSGYGGFKNANVLVEIVCCEFEEDHVWETMPGFINTPVNDYVEEVQAQRPSVLLEFPINRVLEKTDQMSMFA